MNHDEIVREVGLNYYQLTDYLKKKYGCAQYNYYTNENCHSINPKGSRTSEGLYRHHIDEDKGGNLSKCATGQPYSWQSKERIVYCNAIEHLILHMKIAVLRQRSKLRKPQDLEHFFTTGGVFAVCNEINDAFIGEEPKANWRKNCFAVYSENYDDYILLLKSILLYLERSYVGEKEGRCLTVGNEMRDGNRKRFIITAVSPSMRRVTLKSKSGKEWRCCPEFLTYKYEDGLDIVAHKLSLGYSTYYEAILEKINNTEAMPLTSILADCWLIDYHAHGFPQYESIQLTEDFGATNADEYLYKGLPMYCDQTESIKDKSIIFWKGSEIPDIARDKFFVVRFSASFDIKIGEEPFVQYRDQNAFFYNPTEDYFQISNERNFMQKRAVVLSSSRKGIGGSLLSPMETILLNTMPNDQTVILTLGKNDFDLFQQRYEIHSLIILDGCYFE